MPARKVSREDLAAAADLYISGLSIAQVASRFGITRTAMHQRLKAIGYTPRPQLKFGPENHFFRGGESASDQAQNKLEKAVEAGIVQRKDACEICGSSRRFRDGRSGIQAHHCDYNRPLDVMWLCQPCHHEWHRRNKAIPRTNEGGLL